MSKHRIRQVDHVPRIRQQRSVPGVWPTSAQAYHEAPKPATKPIPTSSDGIGRFPTVGLDEGAIAQTRPDTSPINKR